MPPLSSSTWRSMISAASVDASRWRACARRVSSRSNSGVRSWTKIVSFSGSCAGGITGILYIKTIGKGHAFFSKSRDFFVLAWPVGLDEGQTSQ